MTKTMLVAALLLATPDYRTVPPTRQAAEGR